MPRLVSIGALGGGTGMVLGPAEEPPMTNKCTATSAPAASVKSQPVVPRAPTKIDRLVAILKSPDGASIEELSDSLGWLAHTVRAALTGLRKKGHVIVRGQQGSVTVYRIEP